MDGHESNPDDLKLFQKMKQKAIDEKWVYDKISFKKDVQEFHDKIREAFQIHDKIETRIHINTKQEKASDDKTFWAWFHIYQNIVRAYYATQRYRP